VASTGGTNYYESIMKTGGMSTEQITIAMYFIPFINAAMTAVSGFLTDALGRKRSAVVLSGIACAGLTSFIFCSSFGISPVLVGISYGFFIGGLWSACDILFIMIPGESTPTHLRVSVVGTMGIMSGIGNVISIALMTVGMLFVKSIGLLCMCVCVPFLVIAIIILITCVNETKGVDLTTVTGSEWD
jgi:MFS family permease